jgi:hypothetical protein
MITNGEVWVMKKTVYVPLGPRSLQCACGAEIEMPKNKRPPANEIVIIGECKTCDVEFVHHVEIAGKSEFIRLVYVPDESLVYCPCGEAIDMDNYTCLGNGAPLYIGYCLPCGIEFRSM